MGQQAPVADHAPAILHPGQKRLLAIEAVRGVAAAAVVLYHVARHLHWNYDVPGLMHVFQAGHAGVDLFFVVSGFIILFVHQPDLGRPERLRRYLARRFNRVMPLYWVALTLTVLMAAGGGHAWPEAGRLLWSAALLPSATEPLLGVAWTLQFEAVFYAAFAVLILSRRAGVLLFAAWLACIGAAMAGFHPVGVPPQLYADYGIEFFMGMSAALALRHGRVPAPRLLAGVGLGLLLAVALCEDLGVLDGYASPARLAYGVPSALLILGVAAAERAGLLRVPGWCRTLGGASYSIYLFQFVFIGVAWKAWLAAGLDTRAPVLACFALLSAAAIMGGVATARLVEQPLLRWLRGPRRVLAAQPT